MLASEKSIALFIILLICLLTLCFIWLKMRAKKKGLTHYANEQWHRHNKEFTMSENWDDGVGPVRVRIIEENEPENICAAEQAIEKNAHLPAVLCLYIITQPDEFFYGYDLMQTLLNHKLMHGHLDFFHYSENEQTLFSLASLEAPGHFNLSNMGGFKTSGLCLFTQPRRFEQPSLVFEKMVEIGQKIAEELAGILEDDNHHLLTQQRLDYWHMTLQPAKD